MLIFVCVVFGPHPAALGLFLAVHSQIAPGRLGDWELNPVGHVRGKHPTCCAISLAPNMLIFINRKFKEWCINTLSFCVSRNANFKRNKLHSEFFLPSWKQSIQRNKGWPLWHFATLGHRQVQEKQGIEMIKHIKALVWHTANLSLIPSTTYGPLSPTSMASNPIEKVESGILRQNKEQICLSPHTLPHHI